MLIFIPLSDGRSYHLIQLKYRAKNVGYLSSDIAPVTIKMTQHYRLLLQIEYQQKSNPMVSADPICPWHNKDINVLMQDLKINDIFAKYCNELTTGLKNHNWGLKQERLLVAEL